MLKLLLSFSLFAQPLWSVPGGNAPVENTYGLDKDVLLKLVNDVRKKGCNCGGAKMSPVAPLAWNDQLAAAAFAHSKDMQQKEYFSHTGSKGSNAGERIKAAGYSWAAYGENIAFNDGDEKAVVEGWLGSPSHCRTIMNGLYKEMGAGRAGAYWTQDFGTRR